MTHLPERRQFLWQMGGGLGGIALASLLGDDGLLAAAGPRRGVPHHPAKAKRVVQLFMSGAASQCDTFDYKPRLIKDHGKPWDPGEKVELFQSAPGQTMMAPWKWKQYGQCGKWINDCVAPLGECVDRHGVHPQHGLEVQRPRPGHVPAGDRLRAAGLSRHGSLDQLRARQPDGQPADVRGAARPARLPSQRPANWGAGFLPAEHQGTMVRPHARTPIADLFPPADSGITRQSDADLLAALEKINRRHEEQRPGDSRLEARIRSYELAARMQLSAPEVLDLSKEPAHVLKMYGLDSLDIKMQPEINETQEIAMFGRNCLVARRLLERGVRFVQVWSGADNGFPRRNWDSHEDIARDHWPLGRGMATAGGGADQGPETARPARRHDHPVDDGVWPDAVQPGQQGPRPQPIRVHQLARRRRHQGRRQPTGRATSGRTSPPTPTTRPCATTSTPRSCTCWASITRS